MYCQKTSPFSFQKVTFTQGKLLTSARFIKLFRAVFSSATNYSTMHGKQAGQPTVTGIRVRLAHMHTLLNALFRVREDIIQLFLGRAAGSVETCH